MIRKRLQNKVAESRFALPVTAIYATLAWLAGGLAGNGMYIQFALFAASAFMMMMLNNHNSLIRIYSRMVSCTFLVLTAMAAFLFDRYEPFAVQMCMTVFYLAFFSCYQDKSARGRMFYAFLFIGLASIFFIQILFLVPVLWIIMAGKLMVFNPKTFWASVLGLVTPYWFMAGYCLLTGSPDRLISHFAGIAVFSPMSLYARPDTKRLATLALVLLLAFTGIIHYMRNSYGDKIRTRTIYETFIIMNLITIASVILQPQHTDMLLPLIIVNTAPLAAHFIALTGTRLTNIAFCTITTAILVLTAYNIWM